MSGAGKPPANPPKAPGNEPGKASNNDADKAKQPPKPPVPGAKVFSALGPPNPILATRHMSLEKPETAEAPTNRFSIYDLKAVKREILTVFDAAENGDNRAITKFSKVKNFDVDAKDRYGRTALIWAADCGHLHAVETLIRLSANIHATDNHTGRTAIHWAARSGNLPIVRLLVTYGADFLKDDRYGLTPLFLSRNKGIEGEEVFKYLLSEGAPYNETKTVDVAEAEAEIAAEMAQIAAAETARDEAAPAAVGNTKAVVQANPAATSGDGSAITGDNTEVAAAAVAAGEATSTPADAAVEAAVAQGEALGEAPGSANAPVFTG
ncbi:hypothetical protein R1sor_006302 [Riccia sorocarpa]|uniref:Ankyrin repeat domain-containing protein n=1 Tax=Riccia sorocarpa TaxID=122646 RepID=A0ABD3HRA6_9MARC